MHDTGIVMPIYYDFFKEIIKYEMELLPPRIENQESIIKDIASKVLDVNNYMLPYYLKHYSKEQIINYITDLVSKRAKYTRNDQEPISKEENLKILKWTKRDIQVLSKSNYYAVPCIDENELKLVYNILKTNNRFVQYGYIINKENKTIHFVLTKPKGHRNAKMKGWTFNE